MKLNELVSNSKRLLKVEKELDNLNAMANKEGYGSYVQYAFEIKDISIKKLSTQDFRSLYQTSEPYKEEIIELSPDQKKYIAKAITEKMCYILPASIALARSDLQENDKELEIAITKEADKLKNETTESNVERR